MGIVVICSYKPKDGGEATLVDLLKKHQPVLKAEGLITDREATFLKSGDGVYLEIFEWASEDSARAAEGNAAVQEIWGAMAQVCDFVPLGTVEQAKTPFAHFDPKEL